VLRLPPPRTQTFAICLSVSAASAFTQRGSPGGSPTPWIFGGCGFSAAGKWSNGVPTGALNSRSINGTVETQSGVAIQIRAGPSISLEGLGTALLYRDGVFY
jgi:hypothetical protein